MIKDQKDSCSSEALAEILMYITSLIIFISAFYSNFFELLVSKILRSNRILSDKDASLVLSMAYALFLPLMSYLFSQAKEYKLEVRAQIILIWMVLIEIINVRNNHYSTWEIRKSLEQLVRLFWVGFLVCSYTPLEGIRVSLLVLCIYFFISEVLKGIVFNRAKNSYLIGKNPKLIHNYMERVMLKGDHKTTPMSNCDYIVMGEENHNIVVCSNGYHLGKKKFNSQGILTIGRVFMLTSSEDEAFTSRFSNERDACLSLALAKMLMRRFAKLPIVEVGCRKALDFVLQGLIDHIGSNRDIQTNENDVGKNPTKRVFSILQEELNFVSDFLNLKIPPHYDLDWYVVLDSIFGIIIMLANGVFVVIYTIRKTRFGRLYLGERQYNYCSFDVNRSHSKVDFFSSIDPVITIFLILAAMYSQFTPTVTVMTTKRWSNLKSFNWYIKIPTINWTRSSSSLPAHNLTRLFSHVTNYVKGFQKDRVHNYSTILDLEAETIMFCIKVDMSVLLCLPKWIRRIILGSSQTIVFNDAKEAILRSLRNSGGRLTNGETSLRNHQMEHLNWSCRPNGGTTEVILVWHIATTLFHHLEPSPQQNCNSFKKDQEVALALSSYCHDLVKYLPELLPDEVDWIEEIYESVTKEILGAIPRSCCQRPMKKDRSNHVLGGTWGESSVIGKGVKLAIDLMNCAERAQVSTMLAEFWAEMILFIAPSDNVELHQKLLERGELITQLWALLTHAGIVTRPKPTEHQDHESESNAITGDMNV